MYPSALLDGNQRDGFRGPEYLRWQIEMNDQALLRAFAMEAGHRVEGMLYEFLKIYL
jgi:hypothetical protein